MSHAILTGFLGYATSVIGATVIMFLAIVALAWFSWTVAGWALALACWLRAVLNRRPRA